jgi:Ca2+-transporting ATPase
VVIGTGQETEFGKIATMLKDVKQEKTPLQVNLDRMGKWIAIGALSLCAILVLLRLFEEFQLHGETLDVQKSIVDMLIWGVSLAVAAVPEALPAVVTISMALGVNRMVKRHALIRKLPAVETLGCTTIICSDKTGTMTQDQMTLKKIYTSGKLVDITGTGYEPQGDFLIDGKVLKADANDDLHRLLVAANLCSDTTLFNSDGQWKIKGDPTEGAFVVAAVKAGIDIERVCSRNPRIGEVPFSSETKRMTAIYHEPRGIVAYSNGAAEVIVNSCKYVYVSGREIELDENERNKIHSVIQNMASDALRVLGTAYKHLPDNFVMDESASTGMVLLGLGGMIDPPRPEVRESIETCVNAGIRTVMITGDHKVTAVAIARELGILKDGLAVTGSELNGMSQVDFENKVGSIEVYARVSPEHKLRVVEALAVKGHVVAMTGDGINDAPALKKADIGIAMGIKGTDVTKESAEMILTDDNFASIVSAVEEGRAIFGNIKKYLVYLLSCNIGEILLMALAILFGPLLGLPGGVVPLIAIQILYVNLATDGLPALALSVDPHSKDIMNEKPRPRNQNIFSGPVLNYMLLAGLITCIVPLGVFIWALDNGKQMVEAQCLCFVTLILIQFVNAFSCRSLEKSMFNLGVKSNKWLLAAIAWEICLLAAIIYIPALREPFNTYPLDVQDWLIAVTGAGTLVIAAEIYKAAYRSSPIK